MYGKYHLNVEEAQGRRASAPITGATNAISQKFLHFTGEAHAVLFKMEQMHDLVIGLFINRYEFGLPL